MSAYNASDSKDIWDYIRQLPPLPSDSNNFPNILRRKRFGNSKGTGAYAEDRVALEISENIGWSCTKEATQGSLIDLFAISLQPPYKIALIQVKSAQDSRTIHVDAKHMEFDIGPVWIILAETEPGEYEYLVFSHCEFKKYVIENARYYGIEQGYKNPEWDFSVPTKLEHTRFESFIGQWWKIEKNARLYIK